MPWTKDREDLDFFAMATRNNIVVLGSRTFDELFKNSPVWRDRMILIMSHESTMIFDCGDHVGHFAPGVDRIIKEFTLKPIDLFVAGGGEIFKAWMPHIRRYFITSVDYDGEADTWLRNPWDQS